MNKWNIRDIISHIVTLLLIGMQTIFTICMVLFLLFILGATMIRTECVKIYNGNNTTTAHNQEEVIPHE